MKSLVTPPIRLSAKALRYSDNKPNQGISLTELLVSSVVATMVLSIALGGAMFNRKLYDQDQVRTRVNQNIRSAIDLVGADIQQAGERVPRDQRFPVLEVRQNGSNSSLIMRRHILDQPLSICRDIADGSHTTSLRVFTRFLNTPDEVRAPGNCAELRDERGDPLATPPAVDDDLAQWQAAITENSGRLRAYLYNGDGSGQFVQVIGITPNNPGGNPTGTSREIQIVPVSSQALYASGTARLYLLEERKYEVINNTLKMTVDDGVPQDLISGIEQMQVSVGVNNQRLSNFCARLTISPCVDVVAGTEDAWSAVNALKVTIKASDPVSGNGILDAKSEEGSRTMSETFFPRNILNFK